MSLIQVSANARAELATTGKWKVYKRTDTGVEYHEDKLKEARDKKEPGVEGAGGFVRRDLVKKMGVHPVIKDKDGKAIETTMSYVWVPVGEYDSEEAAVEAAEAI